MATIAIVCACMGLSRLRAAELYTFPCWAVRQKAQAAGASLGPTAKQVLRCCIPVHVHQCVFWAVDFGLFGYRISGTYLPQEVSTVAENQRRTRTWQEICEEVSRERDPQKVYELSLELERALDERAKSLHRQASPKDSSNLPLGSQQPRS